MDFFSTAATLFWLANLLSTNNFGVRQSTAIGKLPTNGLLAPFLSPQRFSTFEVEKNRFVLDNSTGQSWQLIGKGDESFDWHALKRIDSHDGSHSKEANPAKPARLKPGAAAEKLYNLLTSQGYVSVPLSRWNSGYLVVTVTVSNKELQLMIDSGAPKSYLDPKRLQQFTVKWREPAKSDDPFTRVFGLTWCELVQLKLGEAKIKRHVFFEYDMSWINDRVGFFRDERIDGLLGGDFFSKRHAILDYDALRLFLLPDK